MYEPTVKLPLELAILNFVLVPVTTILPLPTFTLPEKARSGKTSEVVKLKLFAATSVDFSYEA